MGCACALGVGRSRSGRYRLGVAERAPGWRQGPDGRWYPPINARERPVRAGRDQLAELAVLVNAGALTTEIDGIVDDPELTV